MANGLGRSLERAAMTADQVADIAVSRGVESGASLAMLRSLPPTNIEDSGIRDPATGEISGDWFKVGMVVGSAPVKPETT